MIGWTPTPDVDGTVVRFDEPTYAQLSPYYQHGQIPVPGIAGMYGESVIGIYEALRLVGRDPTVARINLGLLGGPGRHRVVRDDERSWGWRGHNGLRCDVAEARREILIPAYLWMVRVKAAAVITQIHALTAPIWLYDGVASPWVDAPEELSCAAVLCAELRGDMTSFFQGNATWIQNLPIVTNE